MAYGAKRKGAHRHCPLERLATAHAEKQRRRLPNGSPPGLLSLQEKMSQFLKSNVQDQVVLNYWNAVLRS